MSISPNALFHSDCLVLLERTASEIASLVYLDPPWYTDEGFEGGFWHENHNSTVKKSKQEQILEKEARFQEYRSFLSKVLQQTRRILKSNGILFFHVEPRLSGYVRLLIDEVFGRNNFVTEIILPNPRFNNRFKPRPEHSTLLLYGKTEDFTYYPPKRLLTQDEIQERFSQHDEKGTFRLSDLTTSLKQPNLVYHLGDGVLPPTGRSWRYSKERMEELKSQGLIHFTPNNKPLLKIYLNENAEVEVGNIWDDISPRVPSFEKTNFSAQQSLALLTRIIQMGTNEGDMVFDPFCGSGTTLVAAEKLKRKWIGCDNLQEACSITIQRLKEVEHLEAKDYAFISQLDLEKNYPIIHQVYSTASKGMQIIVTPKRNLQIFLCHSSSDKPAVEKYYDRFVNDGVDAWLDKKNLIPGQDWQLEIQRAVKNSDIVIVFLSASSITKEGFVQKEIKIALDIADEKPERIIFIIPARLEVCEVPERLAKFQWVDLFENDGYERLFKALQIRANNLNIRIK